jgi:hypothetical protein
VLARRVLAPQVLCDEFVYADLARNVAEHGRELLRGVPSHQSLSYPILLAPAFLARSTTTAYELAKAINVLLFAGAGAILFVWARRLVSPLLALVPAVLLFAMPAAGYTALLMTESAFLPAFVGAAFGIALSIERPSVLRQLAAVALVALACTVRLQGAVLGAVLLGAILLAAAFETAGAERGGRLQALWGRIRAHALTFALAGAGVLAYFVLSATSRGTLNRLGPSTDVTGANYTLGQVEHWSFLHLADLVLITGVVPTSALIILLGLGLAGRLSPAHRAFVAVAAAAVPLVLIEVGAYTSHFAGSVAERYTFYLAPLLFLALAVWIGRGLPRPPVATALAMVIPLAALGNEYLKAFYAINLVPDDLGLYVFYRAGLRLSSGVAGVEHAIIGTGLVAVLAVAFLWRPVARVLLPAAVCAFLLASGSPPFGALVGQSRNVRSARGVTATPQWVDAALGPNGHADYLYVVRPGDDPWIASTTMLQVGFWNRSVDEVTNVGTPEICPLPENSAAIDWRTGRLAGEPAARDVVADQTIVEPAGRKLGEKGPLAVYQVTPPLRLAGTWTGLYADRFTAPTAAYTRYVAPANGVVRIRVWRPRWAHAPILRTRVHIAVGPGAAASPTTAFGHVTARRAVEVESGSSQTVTLPAPRTPFRVEISSDRTISPADYGSLDTRVLGVEAQVTVSQSARRATPQ